MSEGLELRIDLLFAAGTEVRLVVFPPDADDAAMAEALAPANRHLGRVAEDRNDINVRVRGGLAARAPARAVRGAADSGDQAVSATRACIVVIEDDADIARLLGLELTDAGYEARPPECGAPLHHGARARSRAGGARSRASGLRWE